MNAAREALDLHNKYCRQHFRRQFVRNWKRGWWWLLVWTDTRDRVCSGRTTS